MEISVGQKNTNGDNFVAAHLAVDALNVMVRTSPIESECLEFQFDDELDEIRVVRHGMGYPNGGECVYSLIRDKE